MASRRDEVLELEHAGRRSLCGGTGADHYGAIMTDDGLMTLADGAVLTRDEVVASLPGAPSWDDDDIGEPRHLELVDDATALVYTGTGFRGDATFVASMASVYVVVDGEWRLALYHQTERR